MRAEANTDIYFVSGSLVVAGGKTTDSASDGLNIDAHSDIVATTIELYDDTIHNFRLASGSDNLDRTELRLRSYSYYGVMFPKQWCQL